MTKPTGRPTGRPRTHKSGEKIKQYIVCAAPSDWTAIQQAAAAEAVSVSEFVRRAAMRRIQEVSCVHSSS